MGPETTTHLQGSSGVRASTGQVKKGDQHNIGQVVAMTGMGLDVNQNPTGVWRQTNVILFPLTQFSHCGLLKVLTHNSIN